MRLALLCDWRCYATGVAMPQVVIRTLKKVSTRNINNRFVERRLRQGSQSLRELRDELRVINEQLEFLDTEAADKEIRAMVAETPDAALEHHEAQRNLEVIANYHQHLLSSIAEHELRQDQLLDKLGD